MSLCWTDATGIAFELYELYPRVDPKYIRFTDLRKWVIDLPNFNDNPDLCCESILESIQMAWLEEYV